MKDDYLTDSNSWYLMDDSYFYTHKQYGQSINISKEALMGSPNGLIVTCWDEKPFTTSFIPTTTGYADSFEDAIANAVRMIRGE